MAFKEIAKQEKGWLAWIVFDVAEKYAASDSGDEGRFADHYNMRHIQLVTERPVEKFLLRFFLRDTDMRSLCIVSPFISSMLDCRFSLGDLRRKRRWQTSALCGDCASHR